MREYQVRICERLRVKFRGLLGKRRRFESLAMTSGVLRQIDLVSMHVSNVPLAEIDIASC
jgi:hypothetical protein